MTGTPPPSGTTRLIRVAVIVVALGLWFLTQSLIGARELPEGAAAAGSLLTRADGLFALTEPLHEILEQHPTGADWLLMLSSAGIDILGLFLIARAILGPTFRPFLGLLMLFALRQLCQLLSPLPAPEAMIWHDPGLPSLLVTYGVANDFFFSGHTAIAVLGAVEVARLGGRLWILGLCFATFEMTTVIVLRAHYTMDVFAGLMTALYVAGASAVLAPHCDRWIAGRRATLPERT